MGKQQSPRSRHTVASSSAQSVRSSGDDYRAEVPRLQDFVGGSRTSCFRDSAPEDGEFTCTVDSDNNNFYEEEQTLCEVFESCSTNPQSASSSTLPWRLAP